MGSRPVTQLIIGVILYQVGVLRLGCRCDRLSCIAAHAKLDEIFFEWHTTKNWN